MMQITPSTTVNRVPRKILGPNANRFVPTTSQSTASNSTDGFATSPMSSSGPNNHAHQPPPPHANDGLSNSSSMMRPSASPGSFPDCWPVPFGNNSNQNAASPGNFWPPLPFGGQLASYASSSMGPNHRMSPSAPSGTVTTSVPLLSSAPPMSYVPHPVPYYNNASFNGGYDHNPMCYPSHMAAAGAPRMMSAGHEFLPNMNHNHQPPPPPIHQSAAQSGSGLENTTVQIKIQCINHSNPVNINSPNSLNNVVNMSCQSHPQPSHNGRSPNATHDGSANALGRESAEFTLYASGANQPAKMSEKQSSKGRNNDTTDYEMPDVPMVTPTALKQTQFSEITQMAMRGCELAERLAHTHRNRPCFKKIDSLCARMKQDLVRQDSVLANINSQGMAWAVKDFIFVFTRIINAWIIIKGYVYNTPDGLAKVKTSLSPDFHESFIKWQDSTMDFVDNLIKSFVNLDQMVQSQRASFQKFDMASAGSSAGASSASAAAAAAFNKQSGQSNNNNSGSGNAGLSNSMQQAASLQSRKRDLNGKCENDLPNDETMSYVMKLFTLDSGADANQESMLSSSMLADHSPKKLLGNDQVDVTYLTNVFQDSEETQRQAMEKGTYFKTGLYNPLKKDLMPNASGSIGTNATAQQEPKSIFTHLSGGAAANNRLVGHIESNNFGMARSPMDNSDQQMGQFGGTVENTAADGLNKDFNDRSNATNSATAADHTFLHQQHQQLQLQYEQLQNHLQLLKPQPPQQVLPLQKQRVVSPPADSFDCATKEASYMTANMEYLLAKICSLNEAKYFFASHFTKNYFPDFQTVVPNFVDLRTIVLRSHIGSYTSLHETVHDLRQIVYHCSYYLQQRPNEFLASAVQLFDKELESILREHLFSDYDFTHITGMPDDESRTSALAKSDAKQAPTSNAATVGSAAGRPVVMQHQDQQFCKTN